MLPIFVPCLPTNLEQNFPFTHNDSCYNFSSAAIHLAHIASMLILMILAVFYKSMLKVVGVKTKITFKKFLQFAFTWEPCKSAGYDFEALRKAGKKKNKTHFIHLTCEWKQQKEPWEKSMANVCLAQPSVLWMKPSLHTQIQTPTHTKRKYCFYEKSRLYDSHRLSISSSCIIKKWNQALLNEWDCCSY